MMPLSMWISTLTCLFSLLKISVDGGRIRGVAGVDYPNYSAIPKTSFRCAEHGLGFFADVEAQCQVFHHCYKHRQESFLCPTGTIFNQAISACDYWYSADCNSPGLPYTPSTSKQVLDFRLDPVRKRSDALFDKMASLYTFVPSSPKNQTSDSKVTGSKMNESADLNTKVVDGPMRTSSLNPVEDDIEYSKVQYVDLDQSKFDYRTPDLESNSVKTLDKFYDKDEVHNFEADRSQFENSDLRSLGDLMMDHSEEYGESTDASFLKRISDVNSIQGKRKSLRPKPVYVATKPVEVEIVSPPKPKKRKRKTTNQDQNVRLNVASFNVPESSTAEYDTDFTTIATIIEDSSHDSNENDSVVGNKPVYKFSATDRKRKRLNQDVSGVDVFQSPESSTTASNFDFTRIATLLDDEPNYDIKNEKEQESEVITIEAFTEEESTISPFYPEHFETVDEDTMKENSISHILKDTKEYTLEESFPNFNMDWNEVVSKDHFLNSEDIILNPETQNVQNIEDMDITASSIYEEEANVDIWESQNEESVVYATEQNFLSSEESSEDLESNKNYEIQIPDNYFTEDTEEGSEFIEIIPNEDEDKFQDYEYSRSEELQNSESHETGHVLEDIYYTDDFEQSTEPEEIELVSSEIPPRMSEDLEQQHYFESQFEMEDQEQPNIKHNDLEIEWLNSDENHGNADESLHREIYSSENEKQFSLDGLFDEQTQDIALSDVENVQQSIINIDSEMFLENHQFSSVSSGHADIKKENHSELDNPHEEENEKAQRSLVHDDFDMEWLPPHEFPENPKIPSFSDEESSIAISGTATKNSGSKLETSSEEKLIPNIAQSAILWPHELPENPERPDIGTTGKDTFLTGSPGKSNDQQPSNLLQNSGKSVLGSDWLGFRSFPSANYLDTVNLPQLTRHLLKPFQPSTNQISLENILYKRSGKMLSALPKMSKLKLLIKKLMASKRAAVEAFKFQYNSFDE